MSALLLTFFRESGNSVLFTYVTPFILNIFHIAPSGISIIMLSFGLFGAIGSRLGGYGVDRFGPAKVITLSTLIHIAVFALLPLLAGQSFIGLGLMGIMVLSMFAAGPAVQSYFIQKAPGSSNLILSLNTSIVHLGLAAGAVQEASWSIQHPRFNIIHGSGDSCSRLAWQQDWSASRPVESRRFPSRNRPDLACSII
ncbi:hypothetical protein J14TS5_08510 [Paenibacillus lautus]|uniref:hypothetical protein n=1 Tax=Paenibacillus lautus TaxID=1401 RepID=UPI001B28706F|nr:hypothetical protein [Paenibacillus lautus]GIO95765.1 hypothetical protein J14TS5_08510 [Paenibacillus lautus]